VSFGLLKMEPAVAFLTGDFGADTVILNNGFDGVKGITMEGTYFQSLRNQAGQIRSRVHQ